MLGPRIAKTQTEFWEYIYRLYQAERPGPFRMEDAVDWALENGLADLPEVDPRKMLIKQARTAVRAARIHDPQNRKIRAFLPAKLERIDERGNRIFDVVYDHIHRMNLDHAFNAFEQRDENINRQRKSASRDLASFLENNPNAKGYENQFVFDFMLEGNTVDTIEIIEEDPPVPTYKMLGVVVSSDTKEATQNGESEQSAKQNDLLATRTEKVT